MTPWPRFSVLRRAAMAPLGFSSNPPALNRPYVPYEHHRRASTYYKSHTPQERDLGNKKRGGKWRERKKMKEKSKNMNISVD